MFKSHHRADVRARTGMICAVMIGADRDPSSIQESIVRFRQLIGPLARAKVWRIFTL
jgi:hypothetical protein